MAGGASVSVRVLTGTSGYSYAEWKGNFYPEKMATKDMLRFYAERFPTVEINNTFYRMPKASVLEAWAAEVPADFKFVLKASQRYMVIAQQLEDLRVKPRLVAKLECRAALPRQQGKKLAQSWHILLHLRRQLKQQRPEAFFESRIGSLVGRAFEEGIRAASGVDFGFVRAGSGQTPREPVLAPA
jgi:hypothetical protein